MKYININSIRDLFREVHRGQTDFIIRLKGGLVSRKYITESETDDKLEVLNYIDDSTDIMDYKELEESNIGRAIRLGSMYAERPYSYCEALLEVGNYCKEHIDNFDKRADLATDAMFRERIPLTTADSRLADEVADRIEEWVADHEIGSLAWQITPESVVLTA